MDEIRLESEAGIVALTYSSQQEIDDSVRMWDVEKGKPEEESWPRACPSFSPLFAPRGPRPLRRDLMADHLCQSNDSNIDGSLKEYFSQNFVLRKK